MASGGGRGASERASDGRGGEEDDAEHLAAALVGGGAAVAPAVAGPAHPAARRADAVRDREAVVAGPDAAGRAGRIVGAPAARGAGEPGRHDAAALRGVPGGRRRGGGAAQGRGGRRQHRPRRPHGAAHRRLRGPGGGRAAVARLEGQHQRPRPMGKHGASTVPARRHFINELLALSAPLTRTRSF